MKLNKKNLRIDRLKIDFEKIRAITEMPKPEDVKAPQRFVGVVNCLSTFLQGLFIIFMQNNSNGKNVMKIRLSESKK